MKKMREVTLSRRALLASVGLTAIGALPEFAWGQSAFDWKRYAGTNLRMVANRVPPGELILQQASEFQQLTGINLNAEVLPEDQFWQKIAVELTSGNTDVDLFMTLIGQDGPKYLKAGWYEPLKPYVDNKALAIPSYNPGDITSAAWAEQTILGTLVGVPIEAGCHGMMSNKRLLQQADVTPPQTMAELEAAAKKLTKRDAGIFGIAMRGKRGDAVGMFANFLHSMGGEWLDKQGNPTLNSPAAVGAFELYGRLLREYGPPGSTNNGFTEVNSLFMSGRAALIIEASVFATYYEDPAKSQVVGNVGYHTIPAGSGGSHPVVNGWGIAMYAHSQKKDAAWTFMQWATSRPVLLKLALAAQGSPRASIWNDPQYKATTKAPVQWQQMLLGSLKTGNPLFAPPVIPVAQARDIIGDVIVASINGENVKQAADKANDLLKQAIAAVK